MTKKERIMNVFEHKDVDYLPSQITFSDRKRDQLFAEKMGFASEYELFEYFENHIYWTYSGDDTAIFYRNDIELMKQLEEEGYTIVDEEDGIIFDRWGGGLVVEADGICWIPGIFEGDEKANKIRRKYLPEKFIRLMEMPLKEGVAAYEAPDPLEAGNLKWLIRDKDGVEGDLCVIPAGYVGTYERAYTLLGWEQYMTEIALNPELVSQMMDKITDYKIALGKKKAELGYKIIHHGDDLGTQLSGFFSKDMFREIILPQYKKMFKSFKENGQYIFMHSCGCLMDYLPDLIDIGLDGLEPIQPCNDLKRLKEEFGKELVFMGGIDSQKLPFLTPGEVKEMALEVMTILGKDGGYIIAPSQEIMWDVPDENVVALVDTIKEYRDKVM